MKKITENFKIIITASIITVGLSYVYAWVGPTQTAPLGNIATPINTGSTTQTKAGDICTTFGGPLKCLSQTQLLPPTLSFSVLPITVANGGLATITWASTNTASCTASGAWTGAKTLSGTQSTGALTGPATKTYTLTCVGTDGSTIFQSATVTVNGPVPTATISAAPTAVAYNGASTITWSSTNTTGCTASGGSVGWAGAKAVSGTFPTGALTASQTYSIVCTGVGGTTAPQSATVTVGAAPLPTVTITATPASVLYNGASTITWSSTNSTSCTATGGTAGWPGTTALTSGSWSTGPLIGPATNTYTLTCTGPGGTTAPQSAVVTVAAQPCPGTTVTYTLPGTSSVAVPSGCTGAIITAIAGGGAGGSISTYSPLNSGGGGGSGGYINATAYTVVGGDALAITVGAGAVGPVAGIYSSGGGTGGNTVINKNGINIVTVTGGHGGPGGYYGPVAYPGDMLGGAPSGVNGTPCTASAGFWCDISGVGGVMPILGGVYGSGGNGGKNGILAGSGGSGRSGYVSIRFQ